MDAQDLPPTNKKPYVILDTNIFGYLLSRDMLGQILEILKELSGVYEIVASKYTYFELVRKGTKDVRDVVKSFDQFKTFEINEKVLFIAALLYYIWGPKSHDGDCIIASTALLNSAYILTANNTDFPEPYFKEVKFWNVNFPRENRTCNILIHLLKADDAKILEDMRKIPYIEE